MQTKAPVALPRVPCGISKLNASEMPIVWALTSVIVPARLVRCSFSATAAVWRL